MSANQAIWFLEDVDLYKVFCPHNVAAHENESPHCFLPKKKDEFIYFEKDTSNYVFLIKSGKVKVGSYTENGKEITKAILQKGEVFGEMAMIGEDKRNEFAQSMSDSTVLCPLNLKDMEDLMQDNQRLALRIHKIIGWRRRKAERLIESLIFKSSRSRVIEYLVDSALERGQKVGFEVLVRDFHTHKDIGALTATSRQTVNSVLNELKKKNIINFDRKRLLIRDLDTLKSEVE